MDVGPRTTVAALLASCLVLSACGSTIAFPEDTITIAGGVGGVGDATAVTPPGGPAAVLGEDGAVVAGDSAPGEDPAVGGAVVGSGTAQSAAGSPGQAPGTAGGSAKPGQTSGAAPAAPRQPGAAGAPGVSDDKIVVGVTIINDAAALAAVGIEGVSPEELERVHQLAIDDVNARGGIAGRKVVPLFKRVNNFSGGDFAAQAQEICEFFTVDHEVFAVVIGSKNMSVQLPACLAQRNTAMIEGANGVYLDNTVVSKFANYYYRTGDLALDRYDVYIDRLVAQGFLTKDTKVGMLRYDTAQHERTMRNAVVPTLRKHGMELAGEYAFRFPEDTDGQGGTETESSNAVLQFRQAGVNRVLFIGSQGDIPFLFMPVAGSQGYFPLYGFSSHDSPYIIAATQAPNQMQGARLVGWRASVDAGDTRNWPKNPTWARCLKRMKKGGYNESYAFICDQHFFLAAALSKAANLTAAGMRAAVDRMGSSPMLAEHYRTQYGPGRFGGPGGTRDGAYDSSCRCFKMADKVVPIRF